MKLNGPPSTASVADLVQAALVELEGVECRDPAAAAARRVLRLTSYTLREFWLQPRSQLGSRMMSDTIRDRGSSTEPVED